MLSKIIQWNFRVNEILCVIGAVCVLLIMVITLTDLVGRNWFKFPFPGGIEIVTNLLIIGAFFALAYAQVRRRHVSIGFLTTRLSAKARRGLDLVSLTIGMAIYLVFAWRCYIDMIYTWEIGKTVGAIVLIPLGPLRTVIFLGFVLIAITCLLQVLTFRTQSDGKR